MAILRNSKIGALRRALISALLISVGFAVSPSPSAHDSHSQTETQASNSGAFAHYIANEGVLIKQGDISVIFDPLPQTGFGVYPEPSEEQVAALMEGSGVYKGLDLVFISHAHGDHFSPEATLKLLLAHPDLHLIAPSQALDYMRDDKAWSDVFLPRITALEMAVGEAPVNLTRKNVAISAVRIPHSGWPNRRVKVQNMVYRVTLDGGATIIHMGDADARREHFEAHADHWAAQKTNTAFPPYWFFLSRAGRAILKEDINADKAIGVHVPIDVPADLKASGADYFSKAGERCEIKFGSGK
jgi:L-ascorbate metabolism protein UlaG (beta-lactamase superfamily)